MNSDSLRLIEDVVEPFGVWTSLEISQDSIYLDFNNVELGNPNLGDALSLSIRFAQDSFISFFYDNIWDIGFLSNFDFNNQFIIEKFDMPINKFKFLDFYYLNNIFSKFNQEKTFSLNKSINVKNIRNDFFLSFEVDNLAIVIGGNQLDFFDENQRFDDLSLKDSSNKWMRYYLNYHSKNNIIHKDMMCENHKF